MRIFTLAMSLAVLAVASSAYADLASATTVSETQLIGTGTFTNTGAFGNVATVDGLFRDDFLSAGTADTIAFTAPLTPGTGGEFSLFLFLGDLTTSVNLVDIRFHSGAYNAGADTGGNAQANLGGPIALTPGVNKFLAPSLTAMTLNNGYTISNLATYSSITFFVQFTTPGTSRLQIDYIANPEPGTLALFGLGMFGMLAFAWRRRSAAKLATAKSAS